MRIVRISLGISARSGNTSFATQVENGRAGFGEGGKYLVSADSSRASCLFDKLNDHIIGSVISRNQLLNPFSLDFGALFSS